jgi:hypothetical protein
LTPVLYGDTVMIYAGTSNGRVFRTEDALADDPAWMLVTGNLPEAKVTDLEIDDDPHVLTAGTYGRGVWQLELIDPPILRDGFESGDLSAWSVVVE